MQIYRCLICGEVYMGAGKPSNCPYCGAKEKHLVPAGEWTDENATIMELSEVSRKNLEKALQLEVDNAPFYRECSAKAKSVELQGVFKYLAKIEAEHASVIRKMLKGTLPPPGPEAEKATDDDAENLRMAHEREKAAVKFYAQASREAAEPRVSRVFFALTEIESDHILLERNLLGGKE